MPRKRSPESALEPGGLFAGGERVPLRGVAIAVEASGVAAEVSVAQRYQNDEKVPVEALYTFPLPAACAVCGFEVEIGGKRIAARVEDREAAFEEYDRAMHAGHGAFLVDEDRPNIFTASVGNLLPGQEAVLRLSYVTELEQNGDSIRLLIPTTVSPRYVPPEMLEHGDPSELDHITPPAVLGGVPYGLQLSARLELAADLREVSCPSHPARVAVSGRTVRVELMGTDVQLDRDFVLDVALAAPHAPSAVVAREDDGTRTVMINFFPDLAAGERRPCDCVFVIDRSGSMGGSSIEAARRALQLCLRSLVAGDRFNIVGFGSTYASLFKDLEEYSQASLEKASKHVEGLDADLGGTELRAPLDSILEGARDAARYLQVILLTDGQVANEDELIDLAAKHAARARIFTFGIGHGASEHLVRGLARASRGQAELIHPNERMEPKILRQLARITAPALGDV